MGRIRERALGPRASRPHVFEGSLGRSHAGGTPALPGPARSKLRLMKWLLAPDGACGQGYSDYFGKPSTTQTLLAD
jgi:hypothetical protein